MSTIAYTPDFLKNPSVLFNSLWNTLDWERRDGAPRREYYCNEIPVPYTYGSGRGVRSYEPKVWAPAIVEIRAAVEAALKEKFEVCFLNGYENSRDALGWHSDNSPEMDDARPIVIVTLGAEREIYFCPIGKESEITKLKLGHGSMCVMAAGMQDTHMHKIPKAGFECGPRVSLTFRGYVS